MFFTTSSIFAAAILALVGVATASPSGSRHQSRDIAASSAAVFSFNFDFEDKASGDVGTVKWDLATFPIRHPFVSTNLPPGVNAKVTQLARSAYAASVTGEGIYCEVFQNDKCERTKQQASWCIMGQKFTKTATHHFPTKEIWPKHLQEAARCLVCDKTTAPGACTKNEERKA
ncbi:hypothetical protein DFH27DRAFT_53675 [Peziza echinospora]|nr:hypothetical protein DFH27DRAFT_53675 [Peziza echinospora]